MDNPLDEHRPPLPPLVVMLFGILTISTGSIIVRYAQAYAPSLVIAAWRMILATLILAPITLTRYRRELTVLTRKELALAALSGFFLALHFASWITSLEYTSVASSVVFVTTTPLWVALLAPFTLRERLSRTVLSGIALALAGGVVVGFSDTCSLTSTAGLTCPGLADFFRGRAILGDVLATIGAIMAGVYVIIGRRLRAKYSLVTYISLVYGAAALFLAALMLAQGSHPFGYPPSAFAWFLLLAMVPQLLGHSSFNWALGYVSVGLVSVALVGEPIGATLLAYLILHETPTAFKLFGAILILIGIVIASRTGSDE